jgi:sucrose-6-phosphate hydrolase SacC (GH32 family)
MTTQESVRVKFRIWRNELIALFPDNFVDSNHIYCTSHQRIGQHSEANYKEIMKHSRPATKAEYAELKQELLAIGYKLHC